MGSDEIKSINFVLDSKRLARRVASI
jgi:hypothetical protein